MNQPKEPEVIEFDDDQDGRTDELILERTYDSSITKQIMKNDPTLDRSYRISDLIIGIKDCSCQAPRKKFKRFRSPKFSSDRFEY